MTNKTTRATYTLALRVDEEYTSRLLVYYQLPLWKRILKKPPQPTPNINNRQIRAIFEKHTIPEAGDPDLIMFDTEAIITETAQLLLEARLEELDIVENSPRIPVELMHAVLSRKAELKALRSSDE